MWRVQLSQFGNVFLNNHELLTPNQSVDAARLHGDDDRGRNLHHVLSWWREMVDCVDLRHYVRREQCLPRAQLLAARRANQESKTVVLKDHAIIQREGFNVPLIGVPPEAVLQECDCCHEENPIREIELTESGQFLCEKCRWNKGNL